MPQTRLGKIVQLCQRDNMASKTLLTPKKYRIVRQLADDFSQKTALCKFARNLIFFSFLFLSRTVSDGSDPIFALLSGRKYFSSKFRNIFYDPSPNYDVISYFLKVFLNIFELHFLPDYNAKIR